MLIGAIVSEKNLDAINPFYRTIFMGALCLFLLELGIAMVNLLGDIWAGDEPHWNSVLAHPQARLHL